MKARHLIPPGVAVVIIAVGLFVGHLLGPFYGTYRFDPDYAYLVNSLGLLQGITPGLTLHPGTTIEELGAVTILGRWLIAQLAGSQEPITDSVLKYPEGYLAAINFVLLCLDAVAVALAVRVFTRRTGRVWLALLVPVLMLCSAAVLDGLADAKPEPLLMALAIVTVLLALPAPLPTRKERLTRAALLGLAIGAGIVTKVTFMPLALFALALPEIGSIAIAGVAGAVAIALLTLPIWPAIGDMVTWQGQLLTHQGTYGTGAPGLPPVDALQIGAWDLLRAEPFFPLAGLIFAVSIFIGGADPERRAWRRLFLIGLGVVLCQLAITVPRPNPRYLLPGIIVTTMLVPLALQFWLRNGARIRVVAAGAAALLCLLAWSAVEGLSADVAEAQQPMIALEHLSGALEHADCRLLPYYRFGSPEYALLFGDDYIRRIYAPDLARLYPEHATFNIWADRIEDFFDIHEENFANKLMAAGKPFCLIGTVELNMLHRTDITLIAKDNGLFLYSVQGFH
jgi:hypothetical protein